MFAMPIDQVVHAAQEHMRAESISGWLLYDYRGMNPIFWDTVGPIPNVTRPCWLWVPSHGAPRLLVSYVDQGRFAHLTPEDMTFFQQKVDDSWEKWWMPGVVPFTMKDD